MEHTDDQHDERQRVTVHHVQHERYEMETQRRLQKREHVVHVQHENIVHEEPANKVVLVDIHQMHEQQRIQVVI